MSLLKMELVPLVQPAQTGCTRSLGLLLTRSRPFMLSQFRLLGLPAADIDDLMQLVSMRVLTHVKRIRDPDAILQWLKIVCRTTAQRMYSKKHPVAMDPVAMPALAWDRPLYQDDDDDVRYRYKTIRVCIGLLPVQLHPVARGFYLRGQSIRQLSRRLRLPIGTVKRRLWDVRQELKRLLPIYGVTGLS